MSSPFTSCSRCSSFVTHSTFLPLSIVSCAPPCYHNSLIHFPTYLSILHHFLLSSHCPSLCLSSSLWPPLISSPPRLRSQCSCRQTWPTRCCGGCAGPTSCWRRWSRATSRGSAARRSARTRRRAKHLRMMKRRWGDKWHTRATIPNRK